MNCRNTLLALVAAGIALGAATTSQADDLWRKLGIGFSAGYHAGSPEALVQPPARCPLGRIPVVAERVAAVRQQQHQHEQTVERWHALHDWKCRCQHIAHPMCPECPQPACDCGGAEAFGNDAYHWPSAESSLPLPVE